MLAGRMLEEASLLLHRSEFRVALVNNQIHQAITNSLVRNVQHLLPFRASFERAGFNFIGMSGSELRFEMIAVGVADIYEFLPFSKAVTSMKCHPGRRPMSIHATE